TVSKITKYNVSRKLHTDIKIFDETYEITYNADGKACILQKESSVYYYDIKGNSGDPIKILDSCDYVKIANINRDQTSILYTEDNKQYFSLFDKTTMLFRKKTDLANTYSYSQIIHSTDNGQLIYVDK